MKNQQRCMFLANDSVLAVLQVVNVMIGSCTGVTIAKSDVAAVIV